MAAVTWQLALALALALALSLSLYIYIYIYIWKHAYIIHIYIYMHVFTFHCMYICTHVCRFTDTQSAILDEWRMQLGGCFF